MVVARSIRKSFGRFWRSVEMITQRPETGSRRSSGIEGVLKQLEDRRAAGELNRHDVEPAAAVAAVMARQVVLRDLDNPLALERSHRVGAAAERVILTRLHLDEHDRLPVARDDVNFATASAVAPGDDCVPAAFQLAARQLFAVFAEC